MRLAFLLVALAAAVHTTQAQTSGTILVQDSTYQGSYTGLMSSSFIGLKLPSGGGTVSITITPGDSADNTYSTSYADHTQDGPYYLGGPSTSFTIGTAGHYWMYLSVTGTTNNYDWLEIRVEPSTYSGTVNCYYCNPPYGWSAGWPPLGSPQLKGPPPAISSQADTSSGRVPTWAIAVLGVVIGLAVLIPASYLVYRVKKNKAAAAAAGDGAHEPKAQVEMAGNTVV